MNQLLWEWFLLNYNGGPEIIVENNEDNIIIDDLKDIMNDKDDNENNNIKLYI